MLVLRFIESMTYEQIAGIVGCQLGTVRSASITPSGQCAALSKGPSEMTEKDLRKALLGLDAAAIASGADARQITQRVLKRDRRRVRILAALTIFLWVMAALGIVLVLGALLYVHPAMLEPIRAGTTPADRERFEHVRLMMLEKTTAVAAISVAVLALAALGTVLLVFVAHTATIRRVNATLVDISEQLKQLRQNGSA